MGDSLSPTDRGETYSGWLHRWVSSICWCHLKINIENGLKVALKEGSNRKPSQEASLSTAHKIGVEGNVACVSDCADSQ